MFVSSLLHRRLLSRTHSVAVTADVSTQLEDAATRLLTNPPSSPLLPFPEFMTEATIQLHATAASLRGRSPPRAELIIQVLGQQPLPRVICARPFFGGILTSLQSRRS
jgi:hypothetical protein